MPKPKLLLSRETLRSLAHEDLVRAAGGGTLIPSCLGESTITMTGSTIDPSSTIRQSRDVCPSATYSYPPKTAGC
jgi:hypothetical protein